MKPENSIAFLKQKIQGIGSALFYSLNSAVLKFPNSVVTTLEVDEAGNIWFFISKPEQQLEMFDWEFPAQLQFYRKGQGYHLNVSGKACIVNDPEEVNGLISLPLETREKAFKEMVLIKVKINNVSYYEYKDFVVPKNNLKGLFSKLYAWIFASPGQAQMQVLQPA